MKKGLIFGTALAMILGMGVAVGAHSAQSRVEQVKAVEPQPGDAPFGVEADWKPVTDVASINTSDFYMLRSTNSGVYHYSSGNLAFANGVAWYTDDFANARMFKFVQGTNGFKVNGLFDLPDADLEDCHYLDINHDGGAYELWVTDTEADAAEFDGYAYNGTKITLREHGQTSLVAAYPVKYGAYAGKAMMVNMSSEDYAEYDEKGFLAPLELVSYQPSPATNFIYLDNSSFYEGNERYAAYFFTQSPAANEWVDFTWDAGLGYNKVEMPETAYEKVILCRMNGATTENNWDNKWNQTADLDNHTGIYKPFSTSGATVEGAWEYVLTVGETSTFMIPHSSGEVKRTVTAAAGDLVSLKSDEATAAGTLNPQTKASNNIGSDYKIKVSGEVDLYVAKDGWSTWVSGYAPASTELQDFCDALLALDCSTKDLSGLDWAGLDDADKLAFNEAQVKLGDDVTPADFGSVVNEAATRYALLVSKGATPIEGVTLVEAPSPAYFSQLVSDNSFIAIIVVVAAIAATGVGLFFMLKKKHD